MTIRRPLSPGRGWVEVSLYRAYADLAREQINLKRYFETIVICCVGFDVLVNSLPGGIRLHHSDKLTPGQQKVLEGIGSSEQLTAGAILGRLRNAAILHWRLDRALKRFNEARNNIIHPIERQQKTSPDGSVSYVLGLKPGAMIPYGATREEAEGYYRNLCHIIDLSGGESPRRMEKGPTLSDLLRRSREKMRWPGNPEADDEIET